MNLQHNPFSGWFMCVFLYVSMCRRMCTGLCAQCTFACVSNFSINTCVKHVMCVQFFVQYIGCSSVSKIQLHFPYLIYTNLVVPWVYFFCCIFFSLYSHVISSKSVSLTPIFPLWFINVHDIFSLLHFSNVFFCFSL